MKRQDSDAADSPESQPIDSPKDGIVRDDGSRCRTGVRGADEITAPADTTLELQRLLDAIAVRPDVRERVVEQLRDEIANDRYRVDGMRVAAGLMREERLLVTTADDGPEERRWREGE